MPIRRFRLLTLMIAVAAIAVVIGIPLHWANWLGKVNFVPIDAGMRTRLLRPSDADRAGQTATFEIDYNVELDSPKPPPGMFLRIRVEIKIEDRATGTVVDRYTFHRHLISGVREKSSGTILRRIKPPRPGQYRIRYDVKYMDPFGRRTEVLNGSNGYDVSAIDLGDGQYPK